ncbi:MAG: MFS transporter [Bryobacteraceae bacterium]
MSWLGRDSEFRKLFAGQAISQIGSRISREGLPLTAYMVLGASPMQMGILSGASAAAVLLLGLFAGAFADRVRRRPIMIAADLGRAALLATVPMAALAGRLGMTQLVLVAAGCGILTMVFDVSYQAYVPSLVEPDALLEANSRLALSESIAEVAGPPLAGVLVQTLTAPVAIAFDAFSFVISAASLGWIRQPEPGPKGTPERTPKGAPVSGSEGTPRSHILHEILEGLRFSWHNPYLRAMVLCRATGAFFAGFHMAVYIIFAMGTLHLTPAVLGVLVAVGGASSIVGALAAPRLVERWGYGNSLIGAIAIGGAANFFIPMAHGPVWLGAAFLAAAQVGDATWPVYSINQLGIRQSVTPPHLLGRVNSAAELTFRGVLPVGALAGGVLAGTIGIRPTMLLSASGFSLSLLWLVFSPVRGLRLPRAAVHNLAV